MFVLSVLSVFESVNCVLCVLSMFVDRMLSTDY